MIYFIILILTALCRIFVYRRAFAPAAACLFVAFIMCDHSVVTPTLNYINHDLPAFRVAYHHAFNARVVRSYKGKGGHLTDAQLEYLLADWAPADKESTEIAYLELRCFLSLNVDDYYSPTKSLEACFKGKYPENTLRIMQGDHRLDYTPYVEAPREVSWFSWAVQSYNAWKARRKAACELQQRQAKAYHACMQAWEEGRHEGSHSGLNGHCRKMAAQIE